MSCKRTVPYTFRTCYRKFYIKYRSKLNNFSSTMHRYRNNCSSSSSHLWRWEKPFRPFRSRIKKLKTSYIIYTTRPSINKICYIASWSSQKNKFIAWICIWINISKKISVKRTALIESSSRTNSWRNVFNNIFLKKKRLRNRCRNTGQSMKKWCLGATHETNK